uniref:Uncharacterized protein n=1 Tax=Arundo donax TaxID=35708 RepID=A0A0A9EN89_ARUDO
MSYRTSHFPYANAFGIMYSVMVISNDLRCT